MGAIKIGSRSQPEQAAAFASPASSAGSDQPQQQQSMAVMQQAPIGVMQQQQAPAPLPVGSMICRAPLNAEQRRLQRSSLRDLIQQQAPIDLMQQQQTPVDLVQHQQAPARLSASSLSQFPPPNAMRRCSLRSNRSGQSGLAGELQDFSSFNDDDELATPAETPGASSQPEPEVSSGGPLSIATKIEYAALPSGQAQDVFGIVTVQAAEGAKAKEAEERQPLDIICVLDVSGSMSGDKLRLVQEAVRFVIQESQPKDRVSIVAFNHLATRVLRLARMHNQGKSDATVATLRLTAGGGTNISSGLEAALEVAERRKQRNAVSAILLLTDGQDGSRGNAYAPLVARAQRAGCSLYAFGFGADHDARLLAEIAEQSQTPFTFVEDVDSIGVAFAGAMGGLASVVAQRVELTLKSEVPLKAVHTPFPTSRDGCQAVVQIPDMLAGERRDVLVEFSVPGEADGGDMLLMSASAKYSDLVAGTMAQSPSSAMRLLRTSTDEPQPEMEPDEEVTGQKDRVEVARTLQTAAAHGDAGEFKQAQSVLSAHAGRLLAGRKSAVTQALTVELQDAEARMQSRSSWEDGGGAEVRDACQMHRMQRSTNLNISSKSRQEKRGVKAMYATSVQQSWMSKFG